MALIAAVGQAQALEGREAAAEATHRALDKLGRVLPGFGLVIVSRDFPIQPVLSGVTALLNNTPLLGFSTNIELTSEGQCRRSVVVALLAGSDLQAQADWWPGFSDESSPNRSALTAQKMLQSLRSEQPGSLLWIVADGLGGDAAGLVAQLKKHTAGNEAKSLQVAGCLSGGDLHHGRTYQIGGLQAGSGGLAAALLTGKLSVGIGTAHGWQPVGPYFHVSRSQGLWIRGLDDRTPAEIYASLLGRNPREWGFPPLNELVRQYPLGLEREKKNAASPDFLVRSPVRMETDGSLRMNTRVPEGSPVHLLVSSAQGCLNAAGQAAHQALAVFMGSEHPVKPVLAVALVDSAWQTALEAQPASEIRAIQDQLGADIPIVGGYTLGQIARPAPTEDLELLNQHILVVLLGSPE